MSSHIIQLFTDLEKGNIQMISPTVVRKDISDRDKICNYCITLETDDRISISVDVPVLNICITSEVALVKAMREKDDSYLYEYLNDIRDSYIALCGRLGLRIINSEIGPIGDGIK